MGYYKDRNRLLFFFMERLTPGQEITPTHLVILLQEANMQYDDTTISIDGRDTLLASGMLEFLPTSMYRWKGQEDKM